VFSDKLDAFNGNKSVETKVAVTSVTLFYSVIIWL